MARWFILAGIILLLIAVVLHSMPWLLFTRRASAPIMKLNGSKEADPMGFQANGIEVELVQGDITDQPDMDAIVNAANAELRMGGGVAGAIHRAAGSELDDETRPLAPISPGEAVMTSAPNLPNRHIIHCLGPVFGVDEPALTILASCYQRALELADDAGLESIAFPAISTGAFGFPMEQAAEVASRTVLARSGSLQSVRRIRWVLFSDDDRMLHERVFESVLNA